jgi:hypothetical protein
MVDCSPSVDGLVISAWATASLVLLPVDGPEALEAVAQTHHAWSDLDLSPDFRIVLTRQDRRSTLGGLLRAQAEMLYPGRVVQTSIRHTVVVPRSALQRTSVLAHAPRHASDITNRSFLLQISGIADLSTKVRILGHAGESASEAELRRLVAEASKQKRKPGRPVQTLTKTYRGEGSYDLTVRVRAAMSPEDAARTIEGVERLPDDLRRLAES